MYRKVASKKEFLKTWRSLGKNAKRTAEVLQISMATVYRLLGGIGHDGRKKRAMEKKRVSNKGGKLRQIKGVQRKGKSDGNPMELHDGTKDVSEIPA